MPTLYLIDGNSYIYRAFYAIRGLSSSDGTPTNAIFGFMNMIMKIIREKKPDYFGIIFDSPGPTHRHDAYEDYKAHRPGMPDELKSQVPYIKEIVNAFKIKTLELPGYEADDLLGTIAKKAEKEKLNVFIVTGDKDLCQVVSPRVKLYDTMKDKITEEKDVVERFGVKPSQFPEIIALMGDASDNIPGAPGIGEKTAVKLLKEFGDIESLITDHEKIKNTRARNAVSKNIDNIRLSKELATILTDISLEVKPEDFKCEDPDWERLLEYFRKFEFSRLVKLVPDQRSGEWPENTTEYITVLDKKTLEKALSEIQGDVTIDTETTSPSSMNAELVGISFASSKDRAYYVPVVHKYPGAPEQLPKEYVLDQLKGILGDAGILKTGHNIKYDFIVLERENVRVEGIGFDTMVASYLLNPNKSTHNLNDAAMEHLGIKKISYGDVVGKDKKDFSEVPVEEATEYSGEDSSVTFRLKEKLGPELEKEALLALFHEIEMPLVEVLADMEMAGVKIDLSLMDSFSKKMAGELSSIEKRIPGTQRIWMCLSSFRMYTNCRRRSLNTGGCQN
jgi:DNA polymerase-1